MNTIEENVEFSSEQQPNGNVTTIKKSKISTSTSSSSSNAATPNGSSPTSSLGGVSTKANSPLINGVDTSSSDDYLDDLKIIGQLKNIEKINEKRRVFLTNTVKSAEHYTSDEKTELSSKISNTTTTRDEANRGEGNVKAYSYNEHSSSSHLVEEQQQQQKNIATSAPKYATLQHIKAPRTPQSPPPKPPMLSRARSIGSGDSSYPASPPPTPKFAPPMQYSNIHIQPTESTIITSTTLAEPTKATCIQVENMQNVQNGDGCEAAALLKNENDSTCSTVVLRNNKSNGQNTNSASLSNSTQSQQLAKEISVKHYERLIEELKCPGCAYPMKSPVYLCQTGHSVCDQCTRVLLLCPLCKEPFTNIRSLTVEALCSKAHFKCQNAAGGCAVRLQIDLLQWHEKQCIYKPMKCFMGRVWGDCQWNGREAWWKDHLEAEHANKVYNIPVVDLIWDMGAKQKPLSGYYVFQVFNEMFNFYEIYDKERVLFTMTCTSTQREKKNQFAYEVTLINHDNEALAITQKYPVHSEYDQDILAEGTCVSILLSDLAKFIDEDRLMHYRVRVLEVKTPRKARISRNLSPNNLPINFQQTQIEGVNLKNVPSDIIVTRRVDDVGYTDTASVAGSTFTANTEEPVSENELEQMKREYNKKLAAKKNRDSGSDTDPEFEAFIAKKWGTPQMHFNRKYLNANANSSDSSSTEESIRSPKSPLTDDKISITSTSYKKRMTNTIRKSFRSLKSDIIEMKPFSKKNSPEKKKLED